MYNLSDTLLESSKQLYFFIGFVNLYHEWLLTLSYFTSFYLATAIMLRQFYLCIRRMHCDKTEEPSVDILIPYKRLINLVFYCQLPTIVGGNCFLSPKIVAQPFKNAKFDRFLLVVAQLLELAKKVQLSCLLSVLTKQICLQKKKRTSNILYYKIKKVY